MTDATDLPTNWKDLDSLRSWKSAIDEIRKRNLLQQICWRLIEWRESRSAASTSTPTISSPAPDASQMPKWVST
jgi:hypothetical protein